MSLHRGAASPEPLLFAYVYGCIINRPLANSAYQKNDFLISQPKHMLWVLKDGSFVSMRRFF